MKGIPHFNNLISAIRGFASLAMMQMDPKDPAYNDLKQIQATVDRAGEMTTQIFQFSRKSSEHPAPLSINETIEQMLDVMRCLMGSVIRIDTNLQEAIWMVSAEKSKVEQMVLSLMLNARNALSKGGIISISTRNTQLTETDCVRPECRPGKHVLLTVADSGTGIPQHSIDALHKSFMASIGSGSSVGLGLIMVARIVRKMNGWMNVQGIPGKGSIFEIVLPAA